MIFSMQPYYNQTTYMEIWKTTSIFLKMDHDLKFLKMEDDLHFLATGTRPNFYKWKTTSIFVRMEDDLNFLFLWKTTSQLEMMQPTTIKSQNNGCGTAPGSLVLMKNHEFSWQTEFPPGKVCAFSHHIRYTQGFIWFGNDLKAGEFFWLHIG